MNIYKKVPIFFYAVFLSLIINDNLYSNNFIPAGLSCEVNEWNKWDEEKKNNIKQAIGLKEAKYIFLTPEKAIYNKKNPDKNMQSCVYQNKALSVTIIEDNHVTGFILFDPHFLHANANSRKEESNNILATASYEYGVYTMEYSHQDINTPLGSLLTAISSPTVLRPKFFYRYGTIRHKRSYYFVVIVRTPNQNSEVYAMIASPK